MTDPARASSIARKFTVVANEAEIMLESVLVAAFEEVRAEEREACAALAETFPCAPMDDSPGMSVCSCVDIAAAIRARSDATAGGQNG